MYYFFLSVLLLCINFFSLYLYYFSSLSSCLIQQLLIKRCHIIKIPPNTSLYQEGLIFVTIYF